MTFSILFKVSASLRNFHRSFNLLNDSSGRKHILQWAGKLVLSSILLSYWSHKLFLILRGVRRELSSEHCSCESPDIHLVQRAQTPDQTNKQSMSKKVMNQTNNSGKLVLCSILSYWSHKLSLILRGVRRELSLGNTAAVKVLRTISFLGGNSLLSSST